MMFVDFHHKSISASSGAKCLSVTPSYMNIDGVFARMVEFPVALENLPLAKVLHVAKS
jgi:hypothetical protein